MNNDSNNTNNTNNVNFINNINFINNLNEFKLLINYYKLNKLNQETILYIIELYELVSKKEILIEIIKLIENDKSEGINKTILNIKLKSLINDFSQKKYIRKFQNSNYSLYEYENYFDIFK